MFYIFVIEESSIRESRPDNVFVALPNTIQILIPSIPHSDEIWQQILSTSVIDWNIPLMLFHDRDKDVNR